MVGGWASVGEGCKELSWGREAAWSSDAWKKAVKTWKKQKGVWEPVWQHVVWAAVGLGNVVAVAVLGRWVARGEVGDEIRSCDWWKHRVNSSGPSIVIRFSQHRFKKAVDSFLKYYSVTCNAVCQACYGL